ncbi:MAG: sulfurtransferase TusA [Pseudomonadota bacterium]
MPASVAAVRQADAELDATGLSCPEPLMLLRHKMRELAPGAVLYVRATDPSTERDFQNYCRFVGHTLIATERREDCYEFWLRHTA